MSTLVVAEHDNAALRPVTLSVVAAAQAIGADFDILVAGSGCAAVAEEAAQVGGTRKVLLADNAAYEYALAENLSALVAELAADYDHVLTSHTTTGKNFLPRVAALLDTQMVSDIIGVDAPGHVPTPDLRRQRHRDREVERRQEGDLGTRHRL